MGDPERAHGVDADAEVREERDRGDLRDLGAEALLDAVADRGEAAWTTRSRVPSSADWVIPGLP
jgi:hypothetical protein